MIVMSRRYDAVPGMRQTRGMAQAARAAVQAPPIELGDFQLSVHRRQFPDAHDRWDGNWLCVTAQCAQAGAIVAADGPILESGDLERFRDELASMVAGGRGGAVLRGAEPNVVLGVTAPEGLGQWQVRVELTPEPRSQGHWFAFAVDPSYAVQAVRQLDAVLALYPVRGRPPAECPPAAECPLAPD
jgi:hypothetical protein